MVFLHRSIKTMTPERVEELRRRFEWTVTQESFAKARDMTPKDDVARFYKLVFVRSPRPRLPPLTARTRRSSTSARRPTPRSTSRPPSA